LAKFRQEKKKRKTLDSDGANERPKFTQNNNWVLKRERERERERERLWSREREIVFFLRLQFLIDVCVARLLLLLVFLHTHSKKLCIYHCNHGNRFKEF